jgi:hypothetical protein
VTGLELLRDDASADDELPPIIAAQHKEFRMVDPDAITRITVYAKDTKALAEALGLPVETDPSKVVRIAREKLVERGLAKPLTQDEWVQMGARFYQERA